MTDRLIEIKEGDRSATLPDVDVETAAALSRLGIGSMTPLGGDQWRVTNIRKVGVVRTAGVELHVHPKVTIDRLFYLLSRGRQWGEWFDDEVDLADADDYYSAIAEVFGRWGERVLRSGVLMSYREHRSAEPFIRGRWLAREQINRRFGMPLPAELQYDEFTSDNPENQLVRSAALRLLRASEIPDLARARIHRIERQLADVTPLVAGGRLPDVLFDRRNDRYQPLLALARLILDGESLEYYGGTSTASGYLLDPAKVFEDFVEAEVTRHAIPFGGEIVPQHRSKLAVDGPLTIKPDLIWRHHGRVRAVLDAKYKVVHSDAYPNADIYQMLAYCVRHGVPEGHLIYADGVPLPREVAIRAGGVGPIVVRIHAHAVDLAASPASIESQMREIVSQALI